MDGTDIVRDITLGAGDTEIEELTNVNGSLFFVAGGGLWSSDGTAGNTVEISAFAGAYEGPTELTNLNGSLFFLNDFGSNGPQIWMSDGTTDGTERVTEVSGLLPSGLANVNGRLFFSARGGNIAGHELWMSDGTADGTNLLKDVATDGNDAYPENFANVNGTLFFSATTSE